MRTTKRLGTAAVALALAFGGAACETDDTGDGGEGNVEEIVEETVDEVDELGTEEGTGTEQPNTGDDVGDESPGEG